MKIKIEQKCDRSGRTEEITIESAEVAQYEGRQQKKEATLEGIKEFIAQIPDEAMPDLITVYHGKMYSFVNVSKTFCDKPVLRLIGQLFHASDPKTRAKKAKDSKTKGKKTGKASKKPTDTTE